MYVSSRHFLNGSISGVFIYDKRSLKCFLYVNVK